MAKATTTIRQVLNHETAHGEWLRANQAVFNRVASFYFDVIQAHVGVLELSNKEALTALEKLTHATELNPHPIMPLCEVEEDVPVEKKIKNPIKIEKQIKTIEQTRICAIDLNINEHLAVCTVRDVEGSTLATLFIGGGQRVSGFRKRHLGRIARNRKQTGNIAEGEQDNADLWTKIRNVDDHLAHLVSRRIVQFAQEHEATVLVFEHLGNLKPAKGKYSKRGNESSNGHGTAQDSHPRMVGPVRDFTNPLRPQLGRGYATPAQGSDYVGESEAAGL